MAMIERVDLWSGLKEGDDKLPGVAPPCRMIKRYRSSGDPDGSKVTARSLHTT